MRTRWFQTIQLLLIVLLLVPPVGARQREYAVGLSLNVVSGGSEGLGTGDSGPLRNTRAFYGAYPSIALTSAGARSTFDMTYAFGLNQTESESRYQSKSHIASLTWSRSMGPRGNLRLSDRFEMSSDIRSFNAFRGITTDPDTLAFLFGPVAVIEVVRDNSADISFDYTPSATSSWSVRTGHRMRDYLDVDQSAYSLSDQHQFLAGLSYRRRMSTRTSWRAGLTTTYTTFDALEDSITNSGQIGYSAELARNLTFQLDGGPTYVSSRDLGEGYLSYSASARLTREAQNTAFSIYYAATGGQSSGLGWISDTRQAGVALSRTGRGLQLFLDVSVFDARGRLGSTERQRGLSGSAAIGHSLTETLSLRVGAGYQRYLETSVFGFTQERVFLSLNYSDPDLWTFLK